MNLNRLSISILDIETNDILKKYYIFEKNNIYSWHIDVMDGKFVEKNNYEEMLKKVKKLNEVSLIKGELHLMGYDYLKVIEDFKYYVDCIFIHFEVIEKLAKEDEISVLDEILKIKKVVNENNLNIGISINPNTKIDDILIYIKFFSKILIMSVIPGKGGQKFIEETTLKMQELKNYLEMQKLNQYIQIDGGINLESLKVLDKYNLLEFVDQFVIGSYLTNSCLSKNMKEEKREEEIENKLKKLEAIIC